MVARTRAGARARARARADFLPGRIVISKGSAADYRALAHLHYAPGNPATWAGIWKAEWIDFGFWIGDFGLRRNDAHLGSRSTFNPKSTDSEFWSLDFGLKDGRHPKCVSFVSNPKSPIQNPKYRPRVVGVGVLSYPTPALRARERFLGLCGPRYGPKLAFVNVHVRTISRVIVHPQFRGLGIAIGLVRRILDDCPTRYVEAPAAMGAVHPFFERAGMTRVEPVHEGESAYFIFDRSGVASGELPVASKQQLATDNGHRTTGI